MSTVTAPVAPSATPSQARPVAAAAATGSLWVYYALKRQWLAGDETVRELLATPGLGERLEHRHNIDDFDLGAGYAPGVAQFDRKEGMHALIGDVWYELRGVGPVPAGHERWTGAVDGAESLGAVRFLPSAAAAPGSGLAHAGAVMAAVDNLLGIHCNSVAFTIYIEIEGLGSIPLERTLRSRAWRTAAQRGKGGSNKVYVAAELLDGERVLLRASSMFVQPQPSKLALTVGPQGQYAAAAPAEIERSYAARLRLLERLRGPDGVLCCRHSGPEYALRVADWARAARARAGLDAGADAGGAQPARGPSAYLAGRVMLESYAAGDAVVALVAFLVNAEGTPGRSHGGLQAGAFVDACAACSEEPLGAPTRLRIEYLGAVQLHETHRIEARLAGCVAGARTFQATIQAGAAAGGAVLATATVTFDARPVHSFRSASGSGQPVAAL
jgi:hypothetical protein